eukprot:2742639-Pleurochrysis_carterae.AAC.1
MDNAPRATSPICTAGGRSVRLTATAVSTAALKVAAEAEAVVVAVALEVALEVAAAARAQPMCARAALPPMVLASEARLALACVALLSRALAAWLSLARWLSFSRAWARRACSVGDLARTTRQRLPSRS